jgi:hypothetical protein
VRGKIANPASVATSKGRAVSATTKERGSISRRLEIVLWGKCGNFKAKKPRIASPAASFANVLGLVFKSYNLPGLALSGIRSATICCPGRHLRTLSLSPGFARFAQRLLPSNGSTRVRGRGFCIIWQAPGVRRHPYRSSDEIVRRSVHYLARNPISLLALHIPFCTWRVTPDSRLYELGHGVPLRSTSLDILTIGLGQEHSSRQVRSLKPAPKQPAHLA